MKLNEFTRATYKTDMFYTRPRIHCNDGFNFSVQGGDGHYCSPRKNEKEFMAMEIGFPSEVEELILEFAEDRDNPTDTVYGYVDTDIIQQVIDKHGGINVSKTLNGFDEYEIVE
jgi:hypothetical protein